jgi:hypothetical protein
MTNDEFLSLIDKAPEKTKKFLMEIVLLTARLPYGYIEPKIEIHGSQIVRAEYEGWRKLKAYDNNLEHLTMLMAEYKKMIDKKTTNKIVSVVSMREGTIRDIFFRSEIKSSY